jgi:hypothetical protein
VLAAYSQLKLVSLSKSTSREFYFTRARSVRHTGYFDLARTQPLLASSTVTPAKRIIDLDATPAVVRYPYSGARNTLTRYEGQWHIGTATSAAVEVYRGKRGGLVFTRVLHDYPPLLPAAGTNVFKESSHEYYVKRGSLLYRIRCTDKKTGIDFRDLRTAELRKVLFDAKRRVVSFDIHPTGDMLAVCYGHYYDSTRGPQSSVAFYGITSSGELGLLRSEFDIHGHDCLFSPDGLTLAVVNFACYSKEDKSDTIYVIDVE